MILMEIFMLMVLSTRAVVSALEEKSTPIISDRGVEIFSGFRIALDGNEVRIKLDSERLFPPNSVQLRKHHEDEKKPGSLMQRFGSMLVMLPLIIQMLSLPGAIASIKMSLLKSVFVAKLALLVMLFNALRNQQPPEIVMVHQAPPPQHHDHFYPPHFHEEHEDDEKTWFG